MKFKNVKQRRIVTAVICAVILLPFLFSCDSGYPDGDNGGGTTDIVFTIYNHSAATIYAISLTPPSGSGDIILYDNFEEHIPAESDDSPYTVTAGIPDAENGGTWRVNVSVKRGDAGGSSWEEFEMKPNIHGFSMHDVEGKTGVGIVAHYGIPESGGGTDDVGDKDNVVDYVPGDGENDWNGVYNNRNEIYLEIFNYNGYQFGFEFYLPSGGGTPAVKLSGVADIDPINPNEANYGDLNFDFTYAGGIFILDSGEHGITSGLYDPENGYDE